MIKNVLLLAFACCISASAFAAEDSSSNSSNSSNSSSSSSNSGKGSTTTVPPIRTVVRAKKALFTPPVLVSSANGIITVEFNEDYSDVYIKVIRDGNLEATFYVGDMSCGDTQSISFTDDDESDYTVIVESDGDTVLEENL